MTTACVGEPVSWLRLERFALGELGGAAAREIADHVGRCPACRACLDRVETDDRPLPALPAPPGLPGRALRRWWSRPILAWTGGLVAAAAALLLIVVIGGEPAGPEAPARPRRQLHVKGAGDVTVSLIRERAGVITAEPTSFAPTDRFKVQVTCAQAAEVFADVVVFDPAPSFPLPVTSLRCGNQVVVPGAFRITPGGAAAAIVCVALDPDHRPDRAAIGRAGPRAPGLGCVQLAPE